MFNEYPFLRLCFVLGFVGLAQSFALGFFLWQYRFHCFIGVPESLKTGIQTDFFVLEPSLVRQELDFEQGEIVRATDKTLADVSYGLSTR